MDTSRKQFQSWRKRRTLVLPTTSRRHGATTAQRQSYVFNTLAPHICYRLDSLAGGERTNLKGSLCRGARHRVRHALQPRSSACTPGWDNTRTCAALLVRGGLRSLLARNCGRSEDAKRSQTKQESQTKIKV